MLLITFNGAGCLIYGLQMCLLEDSDVWLTKYGFKLVQGLIYDVFRLRS